MRPDDVKYTKSHEWVRLDEKAKQATVGITDYAVHQLADLVHVDLPKVGDALEQDAPFGEVESVKTVADLNAPLSGKILEVNKELASDLDTLKDEPFTAGWLIKMSISDLSEAHSLLSRKDYDAFLESSKHEESEEESDDDADDDAL